MSKVRPQIKGQKLASVTFIWMQGERDAKMRWGKAYEASLKGLAAARATGLDARLIVAGWMSSPAAARCRDLAATLDLGGAVSMTGPYTQEDAPAVYRSADAYLMLKHNDPCPNAVLEALACGLPVLYSDSGGVPELVGGDCGVALACAESWQRPH